MNFRRLRTLEFQAFIPGLLRIEADAEFPHWAEADFLGENNDRVEVWVANSGYAQPKGFISLGVVGDEAEIRNLGVLTHARGRGVGSGLVRHVQSRARALGAKRVVLEVRAGNHVALSLYQRCGFTEIARRRDYYGTPTDDAVVMECSLSLGDHETDLTLDGSLT